MPIQTFNIVKILSLTGSGFFIALLLTPFLTHYLYKYKLWKKTPVTEQWLEKFNVKSDKKETHTPRMGGVLILLTVVFLYFVAQLGATANIAMFAFVAGSVIGLIDDFLSVRKNSSGLSFKWRVLAILLIGIFVGLLLYTKLHWDFVYVSLTPLVMVIIFGGAPIDGLDGLAGGVMSSIFSAYSVIAFAQGKIDLAILCSIVVGSLLAFLYFNIPPARFYLGETGMLGLIPLLSVVAILTHTVWVLPIIALPLFATAMSDLLQIFSLRIFKKRIFKITPLHHHFQAIGWPSYKVTMRYWIFSIAFAIIGLVIALVF